jgi:hypothetical protein
MRIRIVGACKFCGLRIAAFDAWDSVDLEEVRFGHEPPVCEGVRELVERTSGTVPVETLIVGHHKESS